MRYGHDISCESPMTDRLYEQLVGQFLPAFYKANEGHCYPTKIICNLAPAVDKIDDEVRVGTGVSCGVDSMHVFAKNSGVTHGCIWNGHGVNSGETKYIIASDCAVDNFKFNIQLTEDPAHYEFFLFPFVTLPHIQILMDGADRRRVEKVQDLISYPLARKFLNTCWGLHEGHKNCSYLCPKCMRTMLNLWCHDALDDFATVYDVEYFHRNFHQYLAEYYRRCLQKDFFITEMRPYFKRKTISVKDKTLAWVIVLKKFIRKMFRLGQRICHSAQTKDWTC